MTGPVVVRTIPRADKDTIAGLALVGVATAHEAAGRIGLLPPEVRPIQQGARIAGSAITVTSAPGDNMMIHAAAEVVRRGDVLVVTTTSPSTDGMFGELLATSLVARGCAGLVINAGVRDVAELRDMEFPVWSRAVHAQGTVKETPGSVNVKVAFGETSISPGDVVIADDDGVMIVPRAASDEVLAASVERESKEEATRARLRDGELGLDFYGLRDKLEALGVQWVDSAEDL